MDYRSDDELEIETVGRRGTAPQVRPAAASVTSHEWITPDYIKSGAPTVRAPAAGKPKAIIPRKTDRVAPHDFKGTALYEGSIKIKKEEEIRPYEGFGHANEQTSRITGSSMHELTPFVSRARHVAS